MKRAHQSVTLLMTVLLCLVSDAVGFTADEEKEGVGGFAKLQRGMTMQQVRNRLGAPKHIVRQILYHRYLEQWIYPDPLPVRLTFDCPRGQNPQLLYFPGFAAKKDVPIRDR